MMLLCIVITDVLGHHSEANSLYCQYENVTAYHCTVVLLLYASKVLHITDVIDVMHTHDLYITTSRYHTRTSGVDCDTATSPYPSSFSVRLVNMYIANMNTSVGTNTLITT